MRNNDIRTTSRGGINGEKRNRSDDRYWQFKSPADIENIIEEAQEDGGEEGEDTSQICGKTVERERGPNRALITGAGERGRAGKEALRQEMGVVRNRHK